MTSTTTDMYLLLRAFVEELARSGMRAACTSPGSRSAPLVLTLASEPRVRCYSHVDERCAGFFALGLAKASGQPVAVACTSGTAAAELLPAAVEAREARVPLLLLTADRPAELRENGAGQAIDQLKLYGSAAKWFSEVELPPVAGPAQLRWIRTLACRAYATALEGRPGAVHLNFPLREPLVTDEQLPEDRSARAGGAPFVTRVARAPMTASELEPLRGLIADARRGVIVAGRHERRDGLAQHAADLARATGWPLLADPLSGARRGENAIARYDAILRVERVARELEPDLVIRVGDLPVSKPLRGWLSALAGTPQVALDAEGAWQDPAGVLTHSLAVDPAGALERLAAEHDAHVHEPDWLARWRTLDTLAAEAIDGVLGAATLPEAKVAAELGMLLPGAATLFVASSMPVRDIETFWPVRPDPPRVLCNRGANGIDGTISSAFGAAAAGDAPTVLLIGDVAFAYDIGGLLAASRLRLALTIVVVDNGGGGIFEFLPLAASASARAQDPHAGAGEAGTQSDIYTRHVATPTGLHVAAAAALYGLHHEKVTDRAAFCAALERAIGSGATSIVEVPSEHNVEVHQRVWEAVREALSR
jgi:2-succinyl-5-enolpyruvyl-6-hydroxy-3-cyclohexene-1-carboxylate synthase